MEHLNNYSDEELEKYFRDKYIAALKCMQKELNNNVKNNDAFHLLRLKYDS